LKPLSIVIITYNRPGDALQLAENISGLAGLEELVEEVIFVNNHSSQSYQSLEAFIAQQPGGTFRYYSSGENLGVSRGRNYAIRQSSAPILVFLDDDALFRDREALRHIVALFHEEEEAGRNTGIAGFKVFYYDTMQLQKNAFPHKQFERRKDWPHFETYYFTGCAHAIRREVFEQAGYYPENFFYGMEEYDLSYRAVDAGFRICYDHRVEILHKESPTGRLPPREKLRGMWVNKSRVAWKYLPKMWFYTTAFLWSLEYLQKSGRHWGGYWKGWKEVGKVPSTETRKVLSRRGLAYLREVEARLTY
jgi:GT2 family glycosyltransferase